MAWTFDQADIAQICNFKLSSPDFKFWSEVLCHQSSGGVFIETEGRRNKNSDLELRALPSHSPTHLYIHAVRRHKFQEHQAVADQGWLLPTNRIPCPSL